MRRAVRVSVTVGAACVWAALAPPAFAQYAGPISVPPPGSAATDRIAILKNVGLDQKPGSQVPLSLGFMDEDGRDVTLSQYFGKGPVVLALVYYQCPMLCTEVLNGLTAAMDTVTLDAGKDYSVVVVSFDPSETPAAAARKKQSFLTRYGREGAGQGVHFLTGRDASIKTLTDAVGFKYAYDPAIGQFAHPALITLLTPEGKVSRYLFGIEYAERDFRLALVEAAGGKLATPVDQALLFCYHYDPVTGKYGLVVMNLIRLGGVLTVGALGAFILFAVRRDRRTHDAAADPSATGVR
jgi:protein SCO1/2